MTSPFCDADRSLQKAGRGADAELMAGAFVADSLRCSQPFSSKLKSSCVGSLAALMVFPVPRVVSLFVCRSEWFIGQVSLSLSLFLCLSLSWSSLILSLSLSLALSHPHSSLRYYSTSHPLPSPHAWKCVYQETGTCSPAEFPPKGRRCLCSRLCADNSARVPRSPGESDRDGERVEVV